MGSECAQSDHFAEGRFSRLDGVHTGLLEPPLVIPGFDKLVLKLLLIGSVILVTGGALIISSIVGVIRALGVAY